MRAHSSLMLPWLLPPATESPEEALRASVVHWLLISGSALLLIALAFIVLMGGDSVPSGAVFSVSLVMAAIAFGMLHAGHVRTAGAILILTVWVIVMAISFLQGGMGSPQLSSAVLIVMLAGFLWSSRVAIGLAALSSVAIFALLIAAEAGLQPAIPEPEPMMVWVALTLVLVLSAIFMHFALEEMDRIRIEAAQTAVRLQEEMDRRRRTEESLRRAERLEALGRLAGGIAHDFNNALTVVLGNTALLEGESHKDDAFLGECVGEIREAAENATNLTSQLLAFGRRDVGHPSAVHPAEALGAMLPMLRRLVPESIEITLEVAPDVQPVLIDRARFDQIVMNLALNARDAIAGAGTVRIGARPAEESWLPPEGVESEGPHTCLFVADSGGGIPESDLAQVFDPFFTTKQVGKGTGLGLATVHGLVTQAGGAASVVSAVGRGSMFRIYLPVAQVAPGVPVEAGAPEIATRGSGERILICEDEDAVRRVMETTLTGSGYEVWAASHPGEALVLGRELGASIDLLLTDVVMPEMDGRELAASLRAERPELPVLFVSGYDPGERPIDDVSLVRKPFTPDRLLVAVREKLTEFVDARGPGPRDASGSPRLSGRA